MRRRFAVGALVAFVAAASTLALWLADLWDRPGKIYPVAPNLYVVPGGGGNTAVLVTAAGVVLVDTKYVENYQAMVDQVRTVTDKPITHVINTHAHADHAGGNVLLPPEVEVIHQESTARRREARRHVWDPGGRHRNPVRTFTEKMTLFEGVDAVDVYYFGRAHTDGDAFVVFRAARVMHAGDVFPGEQYPVIDLPGGGDATTYADTVAKAGAVPGVERVISGHDRVFESDAFARYGQFMKFLMDHARASADSGKDKGQAFAELHLPEAFEVFDHGRGINTFSEMYQSMKRSPVSSPRSLTLAFVVAAAIACALSVGGWMSWRGGVATVTGMTAVALGNLWATSRSGVGLAATVAAALACAAFFFVEIAHERRCRRETAFERRPPDVRDAVDRA